jgi:hypothetical protein
VVVEMVDEQLEHAKKQLIEEIEKSEEGDDEFIVLKSFKSSLYVVTIFIQPYEIYEESFIKSTNLWIKMYRKRI